ncbi:MazG nucleotide pyrophosphohydrolase domain-containing protein [Exiguobacterium qingdaonense]|uniref:MazG nucleotide pyrophosphohydrolase domain-containing protein n=1 Tax=Exiguobacterium qingdaonense TaxID=2751251 RepID=UPI001F0A209B|nr:MazG nucleotide pyrophosphohydrolase domain-containing protein [Exiguobacterium qingdaonense]
MKEVQQKVDAMILHLGGYWRPLSGLARLLEEVGELGGALRNAIDEEIKEELLDVLVISTCLANQYAITLRQPEASDSGETRDQVYFRIVEEAGEVARILNAYEGDKKLKPNREGESLKDHIERLQCAVMSLGASFNMRLFDLLFALIEEKSTRDFGRFDHTPDPITESSVRTYLSHRNGRYWGGIPVKSFERFDRYIEREQHLRRFYKIATIEGLDGFVIHQQRDGLIFTGDLPVIEGFELTVEDYASGTYFVVRPTR